MYNKLKLISLSFIICSLIAAPVLAANLKTTKNTNFGNLSRKCKEMKRKLKTGHIMFHAVNHWTNSSSAGVAIRFKDEDGNLKDYQMSEGYSGRGDGYNIMMYSIISQSRFFREKVDICVDDGYTMYGIEAYDINE